MMKTKLIRSAALFFCSATLCVSAQSAPIVNRNAYESALQDSSFNQNSDVLSSSGNGSAVVGWIEAWFLGVMPSDTRTFLRAAMELAPARFSVNSDATNSFRTISPP
jgi:hypothetical protein